MAAATAIVIAPAEVQNTQNADDLTLAVAVIRRSPVAVGAGYTGSFVAVFFCARCCS